MVSIECVKRTLFKVNANDNVIAGFFKSFGETATSTKQVKNVVL